ncbi:MAG: phosphatase PAP2 family protein [Bacteroidia bacterium]|nr:phosphatase PAP2 family protein [Bacteroidia bacterium]
MIEYLNQLDTQLFLFLNGLNNSFFDPIMYWLSDKDIWIPFYFLIAFLIIRHYKKDSILILVFAIVALVLCDQGASHLIKVLVERLRPSHEPALEGLVHMSSAGPGGMYGFVSSHTANAIGMAVFFWLALDKSFKILKYVIFIWAILVSYSRIYNGVHYPGDVICGAILGAVISFGMYKLYLYTNKKLILKKQNNTKN